MANAAPPSGIRNDVLLPDAVKDYIIEHKLEKVVTTALNRVILQMPEDPYARLAEELSKSSFSVPRFAHLRPDASRARNRLTFHVVVASRGVNIRIHSITMGEAITVEEGTEERWLAFLQDFFQKSFGNLHVDEYISLEEHIGDLTGAPGPLEAPKVGLSLCNQLLLAAAASTNLDVLAFLQHCLIKVGCEQVSPPLRKPEDVSAWRHRWPSFAVPLFHGGHGGHLPKLCCAAALRALPEEAEPSLGMLAQLLEALHTAKVEAVKGLQADKTTASLVVEGVAHVMPTFHQTFQACKKAMDVVAHERPTHGIFFVYAEEAWNEAESTYELEVGKAKTLEELVEFYVELTEDGWLTTLVNPFSDADFHTGCELLKASRPQLLILKDAPEVPDIDEETPFGCFWHLQSSLPSMLKQYAERANIWHDLGDGFGRCCALEDVSRVVQEMPELIEALMACAEVQVIYVPEELPEELVKHLSDHWDAMLYRVQPLHVPEEEMERENLPDEA